MLAKCPSCAKRFAFKESLLGKKAKCSGCQAVFTLVNESVAPVPVIPIAEPANSLPKASSTTADSPVKKIVTSAGISQPSTDKQISVVPSPAKEKASHASGPIKPTVEPKPAASRLTEVQRRKVIMDGFQGVYLRPQSTMTYRFGLLFSSFVTMLLPLIYLAFIGVIIWLVILHLRYNITMFQAPGIRAKQFVGMLIVYLSPLIAGSITVLFMVKPILAPLRGYSGYRSVSSEDEPILFEFVKRICQDVRAPIPKRIDIDAEVNASASFRNRWWSILRGNDLVLTIGMPLVAGMSTRQLAGIIAHEFGHFSQGAGMRLTFVLRTINLWFLRVIYERDAWDDWLDEMCKESDRWSVLVLYFAKGAVWSSRVLLWFVFQLGNLLTGFVQQQMEFDADKYGIAMTGRTTFQNSFRALQMLSAGFEQSANALQRTIQENRFVDNIPKFVVSQAKRLPMEVLKAMDEESKTQETGVFDSHPCLRDRIAAAANSPDQGRYTATIPASTLFVEFEQACCLVTRDFYRDTLEIPIENAKWISTDSIVAEESVEDEARQAILNLGKECLQPGRSLILPSYLLEPSDNLKLSAAVFGRAKAFMDKHRDQYRQFISSEESKKELDGKKGWMEELQLHVSSIDKSILQGLATTSVANSKGHENVLGANLYLRAVGARIYQAGRLLKTTKVQEKIEDGSGWVERVDRVIAVLFVMEQLLEQVHCIEDRLGYLIYALGHLESNQENQASIINEAGRSMQQIIEYVQDCHSRLNDVAYPYAHAEEGKSAGDVLLPAPLATDDLIDNAQKASAFTESFLQLRNRCIGSLALMAEKVEAVMEPAVT